MIFATDIQWQLISKVWTKQFREKNDTEFKLPVSNFSVYLLVMHLKKKKKSITEIHCVPANIGQGFKRYASALQVNTTKSMSLNTLRASNLFFQTLSNGILCHDYLINFERVLNLGKSLKIDNCRASQSSYSKFLPKYKTCKINHLGQLCKRNDIKNSMTQSISAHQPAFRLQPPIVDWHIFKALDKVSWDILHVQLVCTAQPSQGGWASCAITGFLKSNMHQVRIKKKKMFLSFLFKLKASNNANMWASQKLTAVSPHNCLLLKEDQQKQKHHNNYLVHNKLSAQTSGVTRISILRIVSSLNVLQ